MVPHPQSRPRQVSQRPPTRSATTLTGGLILHAKVELISSQSQAIRLQLPELGLSVGDCEARADCQCGELINRIAASAPLRQAPLRRAARACAGAIRLTGRITAPG